MPEIKKRKHEIEPEEDEDIVLKVGGFRFYFQNYYTIISLANDLLTGGLYFIGSLANLFGAPQIMGQLMYIAGGFFLLMRPILKIVHNVFVYDKEEYQEKVIDAGLMEGEESEEENKEDEEQQDQTYNEEYYGEEAEQEEKKEEVKEQEKEE